ncbi:MAG: class I SAM-dependent methyltransferase [Deltaproteobacteria bacterium]|nr:class I SAM-dependent methyltransferase [Deltaproteobacteria bacterium]
MNNQEKNNVGYYNKLWTEDWYDMERFNPTARHLETIIIGLLRRIYPVQNLLDIGCGIGVNLKRIHKHFPDIQLTGSDLSEDILNLARDYVKEADIEYFCLDLGKDKLDRKFDVVLCSQVLEHIEDDETAFKNMALMCRKYVIITVPGGAYNSTSKLVGHYRHYTKDALVKMVKSCGFNILYAREWGFPFHSLYKFMLDMLPTESKVKIGLGKYGFFKRGVSHILYLLFLCNIFNRGANIILLAERNN